MLLLAMTCLLAVGIVDAADEDERVEANIQATTQPGTYTDRGADTCLKCHDEDDDYPVFDIFKTRHAQPGDPRSPFAGLQCEACHGPGPERKGTPADPGFRPRLRGSDRQAE